MTKYDAIYESLVEKVNNEELTLEEANELNELAFEKYSETEIEESITLEETMGIISDYLTEAKGDSPEVKALKKEVKKAYKQDQATKKSINDANHNINGKFNRLNDVSNKAHINAFDTAERHIDEIRNKKDINKLNESSRSLSGYLNKNYKENEIKKIKDRRDKNINNIKAKRKILEKYNEKGKMIRVDDHDDIFVVRGKHGDKNYHMYKGIRTESVNDLRLQVYEAYDAGLIEESTKDLFLDYLNLENYK